MHGMRMDWSFNGLSLFSCAWQMHGNAWQMHGDVWQMPGDVWQTPGDVWQALDICHFCLLTMLGNVWHAWRCMAGVW